MPTSGATVEIDTADLLELGRGAGLAAVGVAPAEVLEPARSVIPIRKRAGLAGEMQFTYRNPDRSTDPRQAVPGARSIVAGAWGYGRYPRPDRRSGGPAADVARYSWHDHYGDLERALRPMADRLTSAGYRARIIADSNALVDRNVAWSAGLGWYGKNSNLLLPGAGSWFVLGAIVTDAALEPTGPPLVDGCGSCSQCIEDCPTAAIIAPGIVDATRCLAWIVQAGGAIPRHYREAVGNRIYGCDDCQDVCPPNRSAGRNPSAAPAPARTTVGSSPAGVDGSRVELEWVLTASDEEIVERHGRWYIAERNIDFIRRTALVVLGNIATPEDAGLVEGQLSRYLGHRNPLLRAHAVWAARRLGRLDLLGFLSDDADPQVTAELEGPVAARFEPAEWGS